MESASCVVELANAADIKPMLDFCWLHQVGKRGG
jgi:hypothetical protein